MTLTNQFWTGADPGSPEPPGDPNAYWDPGRQQAGRQTNVSGSERTVSVAAGSILALLGLGRRDLAGLLIAGVGGGLIYRGATGHCPLYTALGLDTATTGAATADDYAEHGFHVAQSYLIDRSPQELYDFWRNFENLPRIMTHLESVRVIDERRSHWVAKAPAIAGGQVEWDAEITQDEPGSVIAWRSLSGADVDNAGSVRFVTAPGNRGTAVRVELDYLPPAGRLGKWAAKLFGEAPDQQIKGDLRNFKRMIELGEIPTVEGQPHGTCTGRGE